MYCIFFRMASVVGQIKYFSVALFSFRMLLNSKINKAPLKVFGIVYGSGEKEREED